MPDIRGKFFVKEITATAAGGPIQGTVKLGVVSRGAVNRSFAEATPSGEISMYISNPAAYEFFRDRLGKEFYVDFTEYTPVVDDGHAFAETGPNHYNAGKCSECGGAADAHAA